LIEIRRIWTQVEEIRHEFGPPPEVPLLRGAIALVLTNPFAHRWEPDLLPYMAALNPVGADAARRLLAAMSVAPQRIQGYGKGAIVGAGGEIEHGALWHFPGGYAMRARLGESRAIVPSAMKVGGLGASLDVPLGHINAAYVRSHFDAMTLTVPDAPRADEIVFMLVMSKGGRVHSRMGGLEVGQVKGEDGLR
jgi:hypothetical protein